MHVPSDGFTIKHFNPVSKSSPRVTFGQRMPWRRHQVICRTSRQIQPQLELRSRLLDLPGSGAFDSLMHKDELSVVQAEDTIAPPGCAAQRSCPTERLPIPRTIFPRDAVRRMR